MPTLKTAPPRYVPSDCETVEDLNVFLDLAMSSFRRDLLLNLVEQDQAMQALFRKLSEYKSPWVVPDVDLIISSTPEFKPIAEDSPEGRMIAELKTIVAAHKENIANLQAEQSPPSASASAKYIRPQKPAKPEPFVEKWQKFAESLGLQASRGNMPNPNEIQDYLTNLRRSGTLHNGFVLSTAERDLVEQAFEKGEHVVKISRKSMSGLSHSVIKTTEGELFALLRFSKDVPQGAQAKMKIAQNIKTGEFCLVKIAQVEDLTRHSYVKLEAEMETQSLKKYPGMFHGAQSRGAPSKKYQHKHYNFIKILPGVKLRDIDRRILSPEQQCEIALGILKGLKKIKEDQLVHRDIHHENILVDPETMKVNIIDFGLAVPVDENGYWFGPGVSDFRGKGPTIRFANGVDVLALCNIPFEDQSLRKIFDIDALTPQCVEKESEKGFPLEYKVVDLEPLIVSVRDLHARLFDTSHQQSCK